LARFWLRGGLVKFAQDRGIEVIGAEDGWAAQLGRLRGTPILSSSKLKIHVGGFDFISATEVFEHVPNPLEELTKNQKAIETRRHIVYYHGQCATMAK